MMVPCSIRTKVWSPKGLPDGCATTCREGRLAPWRQQGSRHVVEMAPRDRIELSTPAFSGQTDSEHNQIITPNRQCKK
jgi:hypothetical protein